MPSAPHRLHYAELHNFVRDFLPKRHVFWDAHYTSLAFVQHLRLQRLPHWAPFVTLLRTRTLPPNDTARTRAHWNCPYWRLRLNARAGHFRLLLTFCYSVGVPRTRHVPFPRATARCPTRGTRYASLYKPLNSYRCCSNWTNGLEGSEYSRMLSLTVIMPFGDHRDIVAYRWGTTYGERTMRAHGGMVVG